MSFPPETARGRKALLPILSIFALCAIHASRAPAANADGPRWFGKNRPSQIFDPASALEGTLIKTLAGTGEAGALGDGGPAMDARLNAPQDVAPNPDETLLYIADINNHRVRRIDLTTGAIDTFAGNGDNDSYGNIGPANEAAVAAPRSVAVDRLGNVYIGSLHQVRVVNPLGIIDLFAGSVPGDSGEGGPARQARFRTIGGLAVDTDGGLLIADIQNNKIKKVKTDGTVATIAGTGLPGGSGDGGPPVLAQLDNPVDIAVDPNGTIYIAERLGSRIRMIRGGVITTILDRGMDPDFFGPRGIALVEDFFLYYSSGNQVVQRLNLFDGTIRLIAGNGNTGMSGDGGPAHIASLNQPIGIALNRAGDLYIADSSNHKIRFVSIPPEEIEPTPTPTHTPTPSPTFTPTPSNTPTRTPRSRTPSPTITPFPTVTATATPTPFPEGQIAPNIPSGTSLGPNYVFFTNQTSVFIPSATQTNKVKVVLSSTPDGQGALLTSDAIALTVRHPAGTVAHATIAFADTGTSKPPVDITQYFAEGRNGIQARLIDTKGSGFSSLPVYAVVFSAPVLEDIPDIRALVGQDLRDVYRLEDFLTDRDTPIRDVTWAINVSNGGPNIITGPGRSISVEALGEPGTHSFRVEASDGVFSATEDVMVKFSTFMFDGFQLDDAALVDDYAYISPVNLRFLLDPPGVNIADVPLETSFEAGKGIRAAHVAHGEVFIFPEFPGGLAAEPVTISITGQRRSNPDDYDGLVVKASSITPPEGGEGGVDYNFSAETLAETGWTARATEGEPMGEAFLGPIPFDPVPAITDGYGAVFRASPGETVTLFSDPIPLPPGPVMISAWVAVDKLTGDVNDLPSVTLALAEDSFNLSLTTMRGAGVAGPGEYQFMGAHHDAVGPETNALIQIAGTHKDGRAEVYVDNVRVFPMTRDIDQALGQTRLPVEFDGTFETVLRGLGAFVAVNEAATFGAEAYVTREANRRVIPGGLSQSLLLDLMEPSSAAQIEIGPTFVDPGLYPRFFSARAHARVAREGGGFFAVGLTNGLFDAVAFVSNDRLPRGEEWRAVTATGLFAKPGLFDPILILQNRNIPGAFPGVFRDGADVAVDDITIEAYQDSPHLWDHKLLPIAEE